VGTRAGLNMDAKRKILCLCWGSNPSHLVCIQTVLTEVPWLMIVTSRCGRNMFSLKAFFFFFF
jgi:hypothetical protein